MDRQGAIAVGLVGSPTYTVAQSGAVSPPDAAGWRAYLDDDDQAVTFCPECAEQEFGEEEAARW